mmetsp:Transcript_45107/g.54649  ORF Transcript_45107/g.54649 Transcript_45107/m.54649 type:complete len:178 (+) Transcript_45107:146-679(+)
MSLKDKKYEKVIAEYDSMTEEAKNEIRKMHHDAISRANKENETPVETKAQTKVLSSSDNVEMKKTSTPTSINIEIISGPHKGTAFNVKPKSRYPCFIGRSTGKKFRERGVSLPDDSEVSTTHAKLELKRGKFYFVDTGSTNGSLREGQPIEAGDPVLLEDGLTVQVGGSEMRITLVY